MEFCISMFHFCLAEPQQLFYNSRKDIKTKNELAWLHQISEANKRREKHVLRRQIVDQVKMKIVIFGGLSIKGWWRLVCWQEKMFYFS